MMWMAFLFAAALGCSSKPLRVLDTHDYVFPRLSANGRELLVARTKVRDGAETTDVLVVDVATGSSREVLDERAANRYAEYGTFVMDLKWLNDRTAAIALSDGDVSWTDVIVDVSTGAILREEESESENNQFIGPELQPTVTDASPYSHYFTDVELNEAIASSAVALTSGRVLVQRTAREESRHPVFLISPADRSIRQITTVPAGQVLEDAVERADELLFLFEGENVLRVLSHSAGQTRELATWRTKTLNQCPKIELTDTRTFVFVRPCQRSEKSRTSLWELSARRAVPVALGRNAEEFSIATNGSRIAVGRWKSERRTVEIFECSPSR